MGALKLGPPSLHSRLIGGFGKIPKSYLNELNLWLYKYLNSSSISDNNNIINSRHSSGSARIYYSSLSSTEKIDNKSKANPEFGSYLAGLIEGDGSIAVHDSCSKSKKYSPKILIVFHVSDMPLAEHLQKITECGKVYYKKDAGYVIWQIQDLQGVLKIINYINGYMRTPKIEALHRAINWFNSHNQTQNKKIEKFESNIKLLPLDKSPINSNSWLAGFTDADGNFSITITTRKKTNSLWQGNRVQTFFRIELRQSYHRDVALDLGGISYFSILTQISAYLGVNLYTRTRNIKDKVYYSFMVISHNKTSHEQIRKYFDSFPLYSSKYLAYKDWCKVQDLQLEKKLTKDYIEECQEIKSKFNSKRKIFNWEHLKNLIL